MRESITVSAGGVDVAVTELTLKNLKHHLTEVEKCMTAELAAAESGTETADAELDKVLAECLPRVFPQLAAVGVMDRITPGEIADLGRAFQTVNFTGLQIRGRQTARLGALLTRFAEGTVDYSSASSQPTPSTSSPPPTDGP